MASVFLRKIFILPIRIYQYCVSPLLPQSCRYYPSCSAYAAEAISRHGVFRGMFLSLKRILRCNSLFEGGYDPVPPQKADPHADGNEEHNVVPRD